MVRMTIADYWAIYDEAGKRSFQGLQIAMGISLCTLMREGDVINLRLTDVKNNMLMRTIAKSEAQRGTARASRLQWDIRENPLLAELLQRGRELSMRNNACPFFVSHRPKRVYKSEEKEHPCQLTRYRLCEQFKECRDATGIYSQLPPGRTAPGFREIRSLAIATARHYHDNSTIQHAAAHENEQTTLLYQNEHDLPFDDVHIQFTADQIGGNFT